MQSVVISSGSVHANDEEIELASSGHFKLSGLDIGCCLIKTDAVLFDQKDTVNAHHVLLKKLAFSCNYRDKSLLLNFITKAQKYAEESPNEFLYACIGSDFVARVIDKGDGVKGLNIGDIVIPNASYPFVMNSNANPGIPTNEASSRMQILHKDKLIRVPDDMSIPDAASFTIGAQTAYSMLKKAEINPDKNILITSGKSSTSLFFINAIKNKERLYVLTSSESDDDKFYQLGVKNILHVDYSNPSLFKDVSVLRKALADTNGFDVIIDPFIDIHLSHLIKVLRFNAKYITCGIYNQYFRSDTPLNESELTLIFAGLIQSNISLQGNCLGDGEAINDALKDYASGLYKVSIDSVFSGNDVSGFFDRTYNSKERFGKVVYVYDKD